MTNAPESPATELWCCHVAGPDDVYPAPDYETAVRWAEMLNATCGPEAKELDVLWEASAAPWPWGAESHAEDLEKTIADMQPSKWEASP